MSGECTLVDLSTDTKIKCTDATALLKTDNEATFVGHAVVNGSATSYRIDVTDNGEPGVGSDIFKIQTANGYTVAGLLTGGNIQVH